MPVAKKAVEATEAPEPQKPVLGYKVVGQHAVYGVEPGGFVEPPNADAIRHLVGAGAIALTEKKEA